MMAYWEDEERSSLTNGVSRVKEEKTLICFGRPRMSGRRGCWDCGGGGWGVDMICWAGR